jgi:hypothetical protein
MGDYDGENGVTQSNSSDEAVCATG